MIAQIIIPTLVLSACVCLLASLVVLSERILRSFQKSDDLIELINELLPQTQCTQCGYPGCLPYAEAVAKGESIDLCAPGGATTQQSLSELLNRSIEVAIPSDPHASIARIREPECIGCGLCVAVCPVDAIVGAPNFLHAVLEQHCTGCELCLSPCPVDCIELVQVPDAGRSTTHVSKDS